MVSGAACPMQRGNTGHMCHKAGTCWSPLDRTPRAQKQVEVCQGATAKCENCYKLQILIKLMKLHEALQISGHLHMQDIDMN